MDWPSVCATDWLLRAGVPRKDNKPRPVLANQRAAFFMHVFAVSRDSQTTETLPNPPRSQRATQQILSINRLPLCSPTFTRLQNNPASTTVIIGVLTSSQRSLDQRLLIRAIRDGLLFALISAHPAALIGLIQPPGVNKTKAPKQPDVN